MGTKFDEVIDLGLVTIRDYKIDNLRNIDESAFKIYLDGFLVRAIPKFVKCLQSLDFDVTSRTFKSSLSNIEKEILACFFNEVWMLSEIQDVTQFQLHLQNRAYKMHSENENLKAKVSCANDMREKVNQLMMDYEIQNLSKVVF